MISPTFFSFLAYVSGLFSLDIKLLAPVLALLVKTMLKSRDCLSHHNCCLSRLQEVLSFPFFIPVF